MKGYLSFLFYFLISLLLLSSCKDQETKVKNQSPNIIIILTDDSGYSDYSFMGSQIATPNIDKLAKQSCIFPNFYNNGRCSPSRASLLTGQYPHKVGVGELCRPSTETNLPGYLGFLSLDFPSLPEVLQTTGYHTIMSGKWHLGGQKTNRKNEELKWPSQRGFDSFFGILGGTLRTHFKPTFQDDYLFNNDQVPTEVFDESYYSSNGIMDHAVESINENNASSNKPFFLYLPFFAPHIPLEAPADLVAKYKEVYSNSDYLNNIRENRLSSLKSEKIVSRSTSNNNLTFPNSIKITQGDLILSLATHAAMMENIDINIGRLVKTLKQTNQYDNTLILLLSDNGVSANGVCDLFNAPYYGRKGMLWEGGIKTPLIVHWPDMINDGMDIKKGAWHIMDIMPTVLDIIGLEELLSSFTGRSFAKILDGDDLDDYYLDREFLFWQDRRQRAGINKDGYKWVSDENKGDYLYNLREDPTEISNIAKKNKHLVNEFKANYIDHKVENNIEAFSTVESNRLMN